MMLGNIGLFKGIMTKMHWLDQNHGVISQNVANADTPGFRPKTLKNVDFGAVMNMSGSGSKLRIAATDEGHVGAGGKMVRNPGEGKQKFIYEASPDNNGVVLEEQLYKANQNSMDYQLVSNLYRRNMGMIRLALQGSNA